MKKKESILSIVMYFALLIGGAAAPHFLQEAKHHGFITGCQSVALLVAITMGVQAAFLGRLIRSIWIVGTLSVLLAVAWGIGFGGCYLSRL